MDMHRTDVARLADHLRSEITAREGAMQIVARGLETMTEGTEAYEAEFDHLLTLHFEVVNMFADLRAVERAIN